MSYCSDCGRTVCECDRDASEEEVLRSLASIRVYLDGGSYGCVAQEARRLAGLSDKLQAARWAVSEKRGGP